MKEGREQLILKLYRTPNHEIISWFGTLSSLNYGGVEDFLKRVQKGKEIHLYIAYGGGGSVRKHKKFVNELIKKKKQKRLVTYLDGRCSSMCTTLFLKGDQRIAGDHPDINLGVHRTMVKFLGHRIPIQSPRRMAQYFSQFEKVNKSYIMANRETFFNQPNNALYRIYGRELLDSGFAFELSEKLEKSEKVFLQSFP